MSTIQWPRMCVKAPDVNINVRNFNETENKVLAFNIHEISDQFSVLNDHRVNHVAGN